MLVIADAVVMTAEGGTPDAEYALFEPGEIELHASEPGTIRELGYRSRARQARARLADAGFTAARSHDVVAALRPSVTRAYARSAAARCIIDRLEPSELLESTSFDPAKAAYEGTWLDLRALATDLGLPYASATLRVAALAVQLEGIADDAPVFLDTSALTALRRPGERTFRRTAVDDPQALLDAIGSLGPRRTKTPHGQPPPGPSRAEVLAWLRDRARREPASADRLAGLVAALTAREAPTRGPLAETALWNLEEKLVRGEAAGALEQIDAIERRRGRVPGTTYLRARVALMTGSEPPRAIAEWVSALSTSMAAFHELQLLAAQAWAAAGDPRRARAFARDLLENAAADDVLRMHALEVLEGLGAASTQHGSPAAPAPIKPHRIVSVTATPAPERGTEDVTDVRIPRPPRAPSTAELMPRSGTHIGFPAAPMGRPAGREHPTTASSTTRSMPPGTSLPPYRVEPRGERVWSSPPEHDVEIEVVETLSAPAGLRGEPPPPDEPPRSAAAARLACTSLARELGHELRSRHGAVIRTDLDGLEAAQRYLREALVDARVRSADDHREVMRHGAFLSELIARHLGARWVDVASVEAPRWAMLVPSRTRTDEVVRVWPFARVLRFVAMGHKERDLVSYYLELELRAR
jgi:hypothetical protein